MNKAAFIMPHYSDGSEKDLQHLKTAVNSILEQTDEDWILVLIDNASPSPAVRPQLEDIAKLSPEKIVLLFNENENIGPGFARNMGIDYAKKLGCPFVLFMDNDDISDKRRLEVVRKTFDEMPDANVVYSTFITIDQNGDFIPDNLNFPNVLEIIEGHRTDPVEGENAWIKIAAEKNYTNLTSSTAVRTELAYKEKFPNCRVSEDTHTWLRYGAHKGKFVYKSEIPTLYRNKITLSSKMLTRDWDEEFYRQKAAADTDGFMEAMKIALGNGNISNEDVPLITVKFRLRLALSMNNGRHLGFAKEQIAQAQKISKELTQELVNETKSFDSLKHLL